MSAVPEKAHAELGASVAARWMACPGSVQLSRGVPNYETEHSRAGTAAHHIAQMCLEKGVDASTYEGMEFEGIAVDEEMVEAVTVFVDYCRGLMNAVFHESKGQWWIEQSFSLAALNPPGPMFGTTDFALYDDNTKTLHVVDLKFGKGVVVEAKGNKQLRYYGLGAVLATGGGLEIEHVQLTIVQPRAFHPEGVVRHDNIDYLDLLDFADDLMEAARKTLEPNAPLHAGSHCRFCPAAAKCPEQREMVQSLAQVTFEADLPAAPPAPETLPPDVLADVLDKLPVLEEWAKAVRVHAQRALETGELTTEQLGQKLVAKRANRRWASEEQVTRWLVDGKGYDPEEIFTSKLKTPKQIETLLGKAKKEIPAGFITKPDTGYTMVPLSDKREAISLAAQDVFPALPPGGE